MCHAHMYTTVLVAAAVYFLFFFLLGEDVIVFSHEHECSCEETLVCDGGRGRGET